MDRLGERILAPLARYYAPLETVEMRISRPHHVVVERRGAGKEEFEDAELSRAKIESLARSLANKNGLVAIPRKAVSASQSGASTRLSQAGTSGASLARSKNI